MITRRSFALAGGSIALARTNHAQAAWRKKPVRFLIGYPAGGPTDFGSRLKQDRSARLGLAERHRQGQTKPSALHAGPQRRLDSGSHRCSSRSSNLTFLPRRWRPEPQVSWGFSVSA